MRLAAIGRVGLAACAAAAFAHCHSEGAFLPLIARGDAVRVLGGGAAVCPSGWDAPDFDDSAWALARLPIASIPTGGVCLRKEFDVGPNLWRYRWLTIRLSSRWRARLNPGKPLSTGDEDQGLDWSADDEPPTQATPDRVYTLDLRLFPTLLQPARNVLALQVAESTQPLELEATLQRDDSSRSLFVHVVKGPYLVRPAPGAMRVVWESERSAPSWAIVDGQRYDGGWAMHHEVVLDGLAAGRVYPFYVETAQSSALPPECRDAAVAGVADDPDGPDDFWKYVQRRDACRRVAQAIRSEPRDLRAAPADGPIRIAVVGDTRAAAGVGHAVLDAVAADAPDLVVHTGDLVADAAEDDWQAFFDAARPLLARAPLVPAFGERDRGPWGDRFAQLFAVEPQSGAGHAYAVDFGPVHVALLDTTRSVEEEAAWLDADLGAAEARGARHLFVVLHWGPFSGGPAGGNRGALLSIVPVVRRHRVDAILSGHDRIYEHGVSDGLDYFVSGGAGDGLDRAGAAPETVLARNVASYLVIDVDGDTATARAKDAAGTVFDQVTLAP